MVLGATVCAGCATGQTGSPNGVAGTAASVFGNVVSDAGGQIEYWVEYGTSTAYGSQTAHQTATVQQNALRGVLVSITGLQRSTTYHYRVCAQDSQQKGGPGCGEDKQFATVNVDCEDTITADLQLSGDLNCLDTGARDGPVVGADGIDIDLAGHELRGAHLALANSGGFDDVTIHGGSLYAIGTAPAATRSGTSRPDSSKAHSLDPRPTPGWRSRAARRTSSGAARSSVPAWRCPPPTPRAFWSRTRPPFRAPDRGTVGAPSASAATSHVCCATTSTRPSTSTGRATDS